MDLPFDRYTIVARLLPSATVFLPLAVVASVSIGETSVLSGVAAGLGSLVVLSGLFAQRGRDRGKALEPSLYLRWDGPPTTRFLRHRDHSLNKHFQIQLLTKARQLRPDLPWPTPEQESADPAAADRVYEAFVLTLRERTRDATKFPLVNAENINYGYRRNLWALKPSGIMLSMVSTIGATSLLAREMLAQQAGRSAVWVALAVCVTLLVGWVVAITPRWVEVAANAYAERLLGAIVELQ